MARRLTAAERALRSVPEEGPAGYRRQLQDAAVKLGWRAYHTHDSRRSPAGFPDLVLVRRDRIIFAEVKRETTHPEAEQVAWLAALSQVPCAEVYLWRPSDWDTALAILRSRTRPDPQEPA